MSDGDQSPDLNTSGFVAAVEPATSSDEMAYYRVNGSFVVDIDGEAYTFSPDHKFYDDLLKAIKEGDEARFVEVHNAEKALLDYTSETGRLTIRNRVVYWDNRRMDMPMVEHLLDLRSEGLPAGSFVRFMERMMHNPSRTAIIELPLFIYRTDTSRPLPIRRDGRFVAYKSVRPNYMDWHSESVLYEPLHVKYKDDPQIEDDKWLNKQPGNVIGMPRWEVDDRYNVECSTGFHVGHWEYAVNFHAEPDRHLLECVVCPSQVVAAKRDAWQKKVRCHCVEVRREIEEQFARRVVEGYNPETDPMVTNPPTLGQEQLPSFPWGWSTES